MAGTSRKKAAPKKSKSTPHLMVIDPAVRRPELESLNRLSQISPLPISYHLPALFGIDSIEHVHEEIVGIIIFGSASSVNERTEWQRKLESWLEPRLESEIPTLGICYGHQMLAHMFGGKVDYLFPDKKRFLGMREVELQPNRLWGKKPVTGHIHVSHNEAVHVVPKSMEIVGKSPEVAVDALAHKELPIWSFQSHPEATDQFLRRRGSVPDLKIPPGKLNPIGPLLIGSFLKYVKTNGAGGRGK